MFFIPTVCMLFGLHMHATERGESTEVQNSWCAMQQKCWLDQPIVMAFVSTRSSSAIHMLFMHAITSVSKEVCQ